MRRDSFGAPVDLAVSRSLSASALPPDIEALQPVRDLDNVAADLVWMADDWYSYEKEIGTGGESHNLLHLLSGYFPHDIGRARSAFKRLMAARLERFHSLAAEELPRLCQERAIDKARIDARVVELEVWTAGMLHWHTVSGRYPS